MHFFKGLANSTLTYVPNTIHICPNTYVCHYLKFGVSSNESAMHKIIKKKKKDNSKILEVELVAILRC